MSESVLPIIKVIEPDNSIELEKFSKIIDKSKKGKKIIKDYPTVYIHSWKKRDKYEVYVGESNDFFQRTRQHYENINDNKKWQHNLLSNDSTLYVIGHPMFNKSLTLDVENKLMHYLTGIDDVKKICNARGNPQNLYYPSEKFNDIFQSIWKELHKINPALFWHQDKVMDSALFKASPLHKLKGKQIKYKEDIISKVEEILISKQQNQLLLVEGSAGTGKTVLMSSIFYDLNNRLYMEEYEDSGLTRDLDCAIVVNHDEQLKVYKGIVDKLSLVKDNEKRVFKPVELLNQFVRRGTSPVKRKELYDVIFVDEAHLLLTRYDQAFDGKHFEESNQLYELMKCAKVVVAMLDPRQVLNSSQYIDDSIIQEYRNQSNVESIILDEQLRMQCNKKVQKWINDIIDKDKIEPLTKNRGNYDIKVFDTPLELERAIREKAQKEETSLSRIVATYDWDYAAKRRPVNKKEWEVEISINNTIWHKPWNYEVIGKKIDDTSWAENPRTINEVGSIYTIQGFDLNYVGVILGPSVIYRDGKIIHNAKASYNGLATQNRTLSNGDLKNFSDDFLRNEMGVLLTRGVNGLYIFACDDELRDQLKKSVN